MMVVVDWPTPFVGLPLKPDESALINVDMQRYWVDRDGPFSEILQDILPDQHGYFYSRLYETVIPALRDILSAYRSLGFPVIHITTGPMRADSRDLAPHLQRRIAKEPTASGKFQLIRAGTRWHEIVDDLAPRDSEIILNKTTRSAFNSTGIERILRHMEVSQIVVGGLASNACVDLTARDGADLGFESYLLDDGSVTFSQEAHQATTWSFQRMFGTVLSRSDVLDALGAPHDQD